MGVTYWLKVQDGGKIECNQRDHSIMCRLTSQLDQIARKHFVPTVSQFCDASDCIDFLDEEELAGLPIPETQWFNSGEGLKTVRTILRQVLQDKELFTFPSDSSRSHWRSDLIEELEDCEKTLESAATKNQPFHLAVIM